MPPAPKRNPARRNRSTTAATLAANPKLKAPALPAGHDWHPATKAWWADLWRSPMAPEYDQSDVHGLFVLAVLVDAFWTAPSKELAAEIRLQRQSYGLSPIDRRRLQWEIDRGDEATERVVKRQAAAKAAKKAAPATDPRSLLSVVK